MRRRAAALLAALLLVGAAWPAAAQDIGLILEGRRLAAFAAGPDEAVLAAQHPAPGAPALVVSRMGGRWGYLSLYASAGERLARHGPFPLGRCGEARPALALSGDARQGWRVLARGCPAGVDPLWLLLPGGDVVSLDPAAPPVVTRWAGRTPATELLAALPEAGAPPPAAWRLEEAPALPPLALAHAAALRAARGDTAPRRAARALEALGPALDRTDWFGATAPLVEATNDTAFWLHQAGGCRGAGDALALLGVVERAAPARVPALLNRADALASLAACPGQANPMLRAREAYRLYCTARGPARVPPLIARRIAVALAVPRLDAEACRPRLGAHRALAARDLPALTALLAAHPEDAMEPDAGDAYPLAVAVRAGDGAAAAALLRAGADASRGGVSEYSFSPLVLAAWNGDVAMLRLLLAHRARPDPLERHATLPLHAAVQASRQHGEAASLAMVSALLDAGAPIDQAREDGRTALMEAAGAAAPPALIALLIARGAAVNRLNAIGQNAGFAVAPFMPEAAATLAALHETGINLGQQDRDGRNALNHLFAWSGRRAAVVRLLAGAMLAAGADPRLPDHEGRSALFRAALAGDVALTEAMAAVPARGPYPRSQDVRPLLHRRLTEAERRPPASDCPCVADWQRIIALIEGDGARAAPEGDRAPSESGARGSPAAVGAAPRPAD